MAADDLPKLTDAELQDVEEYIAFLRHLPKEQNRLEKLQAILTHNRGLRSNGPCLVSDTSAKPEQARKAIEELEQKTPVLDRDDGQWVTNKVAANIENLKTPTLTQYRHAGISNKGKTLGKDKDGRVWRRNGTPHSHPWYLRSTLVRKD